MIEPIRIKDGTSDFVPNGFEVTWAMNRSRSSYCSNYLHTLRLLLLAGFCLLITIGCATRDDLASLKYSLRATDATVADHTTALAAIKARQEAIELPEIPNGTEVISSENEPQSVPEGNESQSAKSQPNATTAVRLFVTHAPFNCPPCDELDRANARGDLDGFEVVPSGEFEGLVSYPAIRFKHKSSATGWAVRYGWSDGQLVWLKANLLPTNTVVSHAVNTKRVVSHSELVSMHNQLHGGGFSWSWPGGTTESLTEHLRSVHGVDYGLDKNYRENAINSARPVVQVNTRRRGDYWRTHFSYRQSCPSGRCP